MIVLVGKILQVAQLVCMAIRSINYEFKSTIYNISSWFSVNTLDIDDCFSAKYDIYFCTMDKVHHRTDANSPVYLRYKYSGGLDTTSSYQHAGDFQKSYASGGKINKAQVVHFIQFLMQIVKKVIKLALGFMCIGLLTVTVILLFLVNFNIIIM